MLGTGGQPLKPRPWMVDVGFVMQKPSRELAYRTSVAAGAFVGTLASDLSQVAHCLRVGDVGLGLESFENQADRLQRFLTFLVVTSEVLLETRSPIGAVIGDYAARLFSMVSRIETALGDRDMMGLSISIEHGLAPALREYEGYARDVTSALGVPLAA